MTTADPEVTVNGASVSLSNVQLPVIVQSPSYVTTVLPDSWDEEFKRDTVAISLTLNVYGDTDSLSPASD